VTFTGALTIGTTKYRELEIGVKFSYLIENYLLHCSYAIFMSVTKQQINNIKGECKIVPVLFQTEHHAMKAYQGNGRIAPIIL
jgi:hypothetical protein